MPQQVTCSGFGDLLGVASMLLVMSPKGVRPPALLTDMRDFLCRDVRWTLRPSGLCAAALLGDTAPQMPGMALTSFLATQSIIACIDIYT